MSPLTFVLVHGAWHGAWCWRRVADILEREGHRVFTPTLKGVGERAGELSRDITLDMHIDDVVEVFRRENIESAVLCPHSYGAWPASGAIEVLRSRVSAIVFVDAHVPLDDQRPVDTSNGSEGIKRDWSRGEVGRKPPTVEWLNVNEADRQWVKDRLTDQPLSVSFGTIHLAGVRKRIVRKAYVRAKQFESKPFDKALGIAQGEGWRIEHVDCGHDVMIDAPAELARLFIDVATASA